MKKIINKIIRKLWNCPVCYYCGEILLPKKGKMIRVIESPKDEYGIPVCVCDKCYSALIEE